MALTIEEQHETNDLDHDILATREVTFIFFGLRRPRPLGRGGSKPSSFHRLI